MDLGPTNRINELIRTHYNKLDEAKVVAILVHDLATATYKDLDPDKLAPELVAWAAVLELRQLARAICRRRQVQSEHESESGSLFEFDLQERYPARRDTDDAYVLRGHLTLEERWENINRLRHEAEAKLQHTDALKAETEDLVRRGVLAEAQSE